MTSRGAVDQEIERLERRLAYLKAPALTQEEMIEDILKDCRGEKGERPPSKSCRIIVKEQEQSYLKDPKFLETLREKLSPLNYMATIGTGGFFGIDRPAIWYFRSSFASEFGMKPLGP